MILKGEEKKVYQQETSGLKKWHGGKFLRFLFCLIHPKVKAQKSCNLETPIGARQETKTKTKKAWFSNQRTRKGGRLVRQTILDKNCYTLGKYHKKQMWPHSQPHLQRKSWKHRLPPLLNCNQVLQTTLLGWCQRRLSGELGWTSWRKSAII